MIDVCAFRAAFPEFEDTAKYPDEQICFWGEVGEKQVVARRWKNQTKLGVWLYTAHEITLAGQNYQTGNNGGTPGQHSGPMNTKTVGSVTAGYDTTQGMEKDAGWWNLTSYGKQFIRLARIFGAGGIQL